MKSEIVIEDASGYTGKAEGLFFPETEAEVAEILRRASVEGKAITAVGARTGVAGGCVPDGGWAISLDRLQPLEISNGQAIAGAGVTLRALQTAAARTHQFYAPDPTEITASVGGSIATNASGSRSFMYGDTRRHVLGLRVVLADGSVLALKRGEPVPFEVPNVPLPATTKFSTGFPLRPGMDFVDLFVGSEGVLGIVTEAALQLLPTPADLLSGVVFFRSDDDALAAVDVWRRVEGLRMLEYMDRGSLELVGVTEGKAALLIEQIIRDESDYDAWDARLTAARALSEVSWFGTEAADRERFRAFRHSLPEAVNDTVRRRGLMKLGTDFIVPIARNAEMMAIYRDVLEREFPGAYVIFGHIGDAHVHANILPKDAGEASRAREVIAELARRAVEFGGAVAAEHGLGKRKAWLLNLQWPAETIEAMKAVKRRLDPAGLLGRGTLFA